MKALLKSLGLVVLMVGVCAGTAWGWSDDFENGSIDSSRWVTHGHKFGAYGVDTGDWQYSVSEVASTDGYLQARVWGPTSGITYGAEAWVRTVQDFNDGTPWLINFTWETTVGYAPHYDGFVVHITDGSDPVDNAFYWVFQEYPCDSMYEARLEASNRLWRYVHGNPGGWIEDTPSPAFSKTTWSVVTDPAGSATIYLQPNGQGSPYRTVALDTTEPWFFGLYLNDATSAGYTAGDNSFRLYDFSATPVPEPVTVGLLAVGGLALLRRQRS